MMPDRTPTWRQSTEYISTETEPTSMGSCAPVPANWPAFRNPRPPGQHQGTGDMTNFDSCPAVERRPGTLGGVLIFKNTRLPLYVLFDNLAGGATINEFMDSFPGPERSEIEQVLQRVANELREDRAA